MVLRLPRGGVPVAFEVAVALDAELDVFIVRKLGPPGKEELAIGAIASGGVRVLNEALIAELQLSPGTFPGRRKRYDYGWSLVCGARTQEERGSEVETDTVGAAVLNLTGVNQQ